jgi:hypothetical protein
LTLYSGGRQVEAYVGALLTFFGPDQHPVPYDDEFLEWVAHAVK